MQNGRLVEQGKHKDLLEMNGEYAKLYNLQAEAFLPSVSALYIPHPGAD